MSDHTIVRLDDVPDVFGGQYPGVMRMLSGPLGNEQVAFTHRVMPPGAGGKGSYGHRHRTQEEVYFVVSGTLQFKLEDEVVDVPAGTAVRVAPSTVRSVWNGSDADAELIIVSTRARSGEPGEDVELVPDFWPE
jgi:mannose-6-phosphate isomerase-like protein (cupin superfamily)